MMLILLGPMFYLMLSGKLVTAQGNACSSVVCQNGGNCFLASDPTSSTPYTCICPPDYSGQHCQTLVASPGNNVCSSVVCQNGGTCFLASDPTSSTPYMCNCLPSYSGLLCQTPALQPTGTSSTSDNLCASHPCQHGATCINPTDPDVTSVICQCAPGYVGYLCDRVDTGRGDCDPNPCGNNGMCNPTPFSLRGYTCECQHGYTGDNCERSLDGGYDGCSSSPCLNGGQCTNQYDINDYHCSCQTGYSGRHCETKGPCVDDPCANGGTCFEERFDFASLSYRCVCAEGFYGVNCTEAYPSNPCSPTTCQNGGVCFQLLDTGGDQNVNPFFCLCPQGYMGTTCQLGDPCFSGPCTNGGTCVQIAPGGDQDLVSGFWCDCPLDFMGTTCTDPGPCSSNPCFNGGFCTNVRGLTEPMFESDQTEYSCTCLEGWTGVNCQTQVVLDDLCSPNPCHNGATCTSMSAIYSCSCIDGYIGSNCQYLDPCQSNPCLNSGVCFISSEGDSFQCVCQSSFVGVRCEINAVACQSAPCQNGGSCSMLKGSNTYECTCLPGFLGSNCETQDPCYPRPCQNGGTCWQNADSSDYMCQCQAGFGGRFCELLLPTEPSPQKTPQQCVVNRCASGSTCVMEGPDHEGNYFSMCLCPLGFTGVTCAIELPPTVMCQPNPCQNGGLCVQSSFSTGGIACNCASGFAGSRCGFQHDGNPPSLPTAIDIVDMSTEPTNLTPAQPCASQPCLNGGTCVDNHNLFACLCPTYFVGTRCEADIRDCTYGDQVYRDGQSRNEGCRQCVCRNAEWECSLNSCECSFGGNVYKNNETWYDDCNTCTCTNGITLCTGIDCSTVCLFEGQLYDIGSEREQRCSTCICQFGRWYCATVDDCVDNTCMYENTAYEENSIRPQYCNLCSCRESTWQCTTSSCDKYPAGFKITVEFDKPISLLVGKEDEFKRTFLENITNTYYLRNGQIQDIEILPAIDGNTMLLQFSVVKNASEEISVDVIRSAIEIEVMGASFVFEFDGETYRALPSSFKAEELEMTSDLPTSIPEGGTSPLIMGVVGGLGGLIVVIIVVIIFVYVYHKRKPKKDGTASAPLNLQQFGPTPPDSPVSPVSRIERSRTVPAHYRFKNPFT